MPKITYNLKLDKNWSLVVTRNLLEEMSEVAIAAGWDFSGCTLETAGNDQIDCPALTDIAQIPLYVLETVKKAKLTYKRPLQALDREYAFVTLENHLALVGARAFSLRLSGSDNGVAFNLRNSLASFLMVRRQWYSWLSTSIPYWLLICLPLLIAMVTGAAQFIVRRPVSEPKSVTFAAFTLEFIGFVMLPVRLRIFPANDFNLTEPPNPQTRAAYLRSVTGTVLKGIGGAVGVAVIAWMMKRVLV